RFADREPEGNVGHLLGEHVDGAINPNYLLVRILQLRAGRVQVLPAQPFEGGRGKGFLDKRQGRAGNVESEYSHIIKNADVLSSKHQHPSTRETGSKLPSTKLQAPDKHQIPNIKK